MNLLQAALMDKPSYTPCWCVVCGVPTMAGPHHVVPRGQGGTDGPTLRLCGSGTTGCHGKAEDNRLHFDSRDGWWVWIETPQPMKYDRTLGLDGWRRAA